MITHRTDPGSAPSLRPSPRRQKPHFRSLGGQAPSWPHYAVSQDTQCGERRERRSKEEELINDNEKGEETKQIRAFRLRAAFTLLRRSHFPPSPSPLTLPLFGRPGMMKINLFATPERCDDVYIS